MKVVKKNQLATGERFKEKYPIKLLLSTKEIDTKDCQVSIVVLEPNQRLPVSGHTQHDTEEICYVISGRIIFETDTSSEVTEEGDLVVIPGNKPYANVNISNEQAKVLRFHTPVKVKED